MTRFDHLKFRSASWRMALMLLAAVVWIANNRLMRRLLKTDCPAGSRCSAAFQC
jgi:hypothetical protein